MLLVNADFDKNIEKKNASFINKHWKTTYNLEVTILPSFKTFYRRNRRESSSIFFYEWKNNGLSRLPTFGLTTNVASVPWEGQKEESRWSSFTNN